MSFNVNRSKRNWHIVRAKRFARLLIDGYPVKEAWRFSKPTKMAMAGRGIRLHPKTKGKG